MKKVFEKTKNSEESISYAENRSGSRAAKSFHVNIWMGALVLPLSQSDFWEAKKGRKQMKSVKAPSSNKFHLFSLDCCLLVWKREQFNLQSDSDQ